MAKTTKVLVTMPSELLERIDRETATLGQTRSEFFQEAVRRRLGWPDPLAIDAALLRGRAVLSDLGGFESVDEIRAQREEQDARDQRR
jgi:Arc/MetJ-type ribon-helix-helix transcriptional regulator